MQGFIEHLQRVQHANRGRLLLRIPGPVPRWYLQMFSCRDQSLLNLSCFRTFEFRTSLGTSLCYNGQYQKESDIVLLFYIAIHDPTIYLIWPDHVVRRISIYIYIYLLIIIIKWGHWRSWFERPTCKREEVGSRPTVGKHFSFCCSRVLRVPFNSNQPIQMKSPVTYTSPISCFSYGMVCIYFSLCVIFPSYCPP